MVKHWAKTVKQRPWGQELDDERKQAMSFGIRMPLPKQNQTPGASLTMVRKHHRYTYWECLSKEVC